MPAAIDEVARGKWDAYFYSDREADLVPRPKTDLILIATADLIPLLRY